MDIKFMVYTANGAVFPLHRDSILHRNLFRVPISLSDFMPDFAMCYEDTKNVFEIARGFLHVVIMDMHAAGRMAFNRAGRGSPSTVLYVLPGATLYFSCLTCLQVIGFRC